MDISIVIPIKNEEGSLAQLFSEIHAALAPAGSSFEVIVVDDGSTDSSWEVLQGQTQIWPFLHGIRFQYNCGKAQALSEGFARAKGKYVITMDGDLQDNPQEVLKMIALLETDFDMVSGWKKVRFDPWHKTLPSKLFNAVVSLVSGLRLHDFNCGLKAYRRQVVSHIPLYGDFHRFIPVWAKWRGFRVTEMVVEHRARQHGVSKYGVSRLVSGFLDLVTLVFLHRFAVKPLHFFGSLGLLFIMLGSGLLSWFGIQWIFGEALHVRPLLYLAGISLLLGVQLGSLGLLGEMLNAKLRPANAPISESF